MLNDDPGNMYKKGNHMYMEQWISDDFGWDKWCNNWDHFNKELLE
jgi:hypothetical protein